MSVEWCRLCGRHVDLDYDLGERHTGSDVLEWHCSWDKCLRSCKACDSSPSRGEGDE